MELIKSKDSRYTDYENLLLRRDSLRKQAEQYRMEYTRTFGELQIGIFRLKIQCIEMKKKIAYCQQRANRGLPISESDLEQYIDSVMAEYYEQLDDMVTEANDARKTGTVTPAELRRIKDIYRHLVKKIHPDRRPDLAEDDFLKECWKQIQTAYVCNQLEDLEELKFKVDSYLEYLGDHGISVDIPDIEEKIDRVTKEIQRILETNPYQYRFLLEDLDEVSAKMTQLEDERRSYAEYLQQLTGILAQFRIERMAS